MTLDLQSFRGYDTKSKGNKYKTRLTEHQNLKLLCKGHNQQSEKAPYGMEENIYKSYYLIKG